MDIFQYPQALHDLEVDLTKLRNEKDNIELNLKNTKAKIIATEIDIISYKSAAVRDNFIIFHLANKSDCVNMECRLNELMAQIREKTDEHARLRREFRLLESEYSAHGVRDFSQCGKQ